MSSDQNDRQIQRPSRKKEVTQLQPRRIIYQLRLVCFAYSHGYNIITVLALHLAPKGIQGRRDTQQKVKSKIEDGDACKPKTESSMIDVESRVAEKRKSIFAQSQPCHNCVTSAHQWPLQPTPPVPHDQ